MYDDTASIGQASTALAMANDAIDNARRAAASSRSRRTAAAEAARLHQYDDAGAAPAHDAAAPDAAPSTAPPAPDRAPSHADLKHNDNAYHVLATLVTERLLPKVEAAHGTREYALSVEEVAFFEKMLPAAVRRGFVDALRYRLQLLRSGVGSRHDALGVLTLQCQMLGLDRDNTMNVLLDLSGSAGRSYPVNYGDQGSVAIVPSTQSVEYAPSNTGQYGSNTDMQQHYHATDAYNNADAGDNGVTFGLHSPMALSAPHTASFSPRYAPGTFAAGPDARSRAEWETSAESLARQQIMAEIAETQVLLRGSVTPDAVDFWRKHLEELSQRLMALSLEEGRRGGGGDGVFFPGGAGGGENAVGAGFGAGANGMDAYHNHGPAGFIDNGEGAGAYPHHSPAAAAAPAPPHPRAELPVCDVVAPSDLPGGYMFEAQLGARKFLATVPPGGAAKGQRFASAMRDLETIEIPVPLGAWRDRGRHCLADGLLHPLFLHAACFPCVALGQIMTRTGLDWHGRPANRLVGGLSCANMTVVLLFYLAMNASAAFVLRMEWERGRATGEAFAALVLFNVGFFAYLANLTRRVRGALRNKYQIPEEHCGGAEDCLCATCCLPCAVCQMGRHTADFDTYRGACCTSTGLPRQVELAPVTFYEDQYQNMNGEARGHAQV